MTGLGINVAWYDYGADFAPERLGKPRPDWLLKVDTESNTGAAPGASLGASQGASPSYATETDDPNTTKLYHDLRFLRNIGVGCVRWYLLGDGGIFVKDDNTADPLTVPSAMPDAWMKDFHYALKVFNAAKMEMIPVLIDFQMACKPKVVFNGREYPVPFQHFRGGKDGAVDARKIATFMSKLKEQLGPSVSARTGDPGTYLKGGRSDWLINSDKQRNFISLLTQIVRLDGDLSQAIYAWEIISEPDMCCTDYDGVNGDVYLRGYTKGSGYSRLPVLRQTKTDAGYEPEALDDFLVKAITSFTDRKLPRQLFTIGFHSAETLVARLNGPQKTFYQELMKEHKFLPNFHYYPENMNWISPRTQRNMTGDPTDSTHRQVKLADLQRLLKDSLRGALALLIGEIATTDDYQGLENSVWPDGSATKSLPWGGAALLSRLNLINSNLSGLGTPVMVLPWAYASGGSRAGFTLRHAAAMAEFSGFKAVAADLRGLAPDAADP